MRKVKSYVLITLTVIAVIVLLSLAGLLFTKLPTTNDLTAIGTLVTGIVTALGVTVAIGAGFYASEQLHLGRKVALGDKLFKIDEVLQQYEDVHAKLRSGKWPDREEGPTQDDWIPVEHYMGVFERIQVLVEAKIVDIDTVDKFYSYRLFNIVANPIIRHEKLVKLGRYWKNFIKLWKDLGDLESNKNDDKKRKPGPEVLCHLSMSQKPPFMEHLIIKIQKFL